MKSWGKVVCVLLILIACDRPELPVERPRNSEKIIRVHQVDLFGKKPEVREVYVNNEMSTIWKDSANRSELISAIIDSRWDGVLPEKYPLGELVFAHQHYEDLRTFELIQADLKFSETFFRIAKQLTFGKVNPKKLYGDWEPFVPKTKEPEVLLNEALKDKMVYQTLVDLKPQNLHYQKYKKAFEQFVPVVNRDTLTADGKLFQKILVNLERSKWLPEDLGTHYVWVNIPESRLYFVKNGNLEAVHKVIVGKKERRTPVLSSAFNGIILNPKWTVPPTILKKDVVPKATNDRSYFESNRLTIFDKKTGKIVDSEDWDPENYNSYRYVQKTGRLNSLGQIKFDFPNNHMVYLHDTNNRAMFNRNNRALSSGCIRVESPFDLAEEIFEIEKVNVSRSEIDTLVHYETTKSFKLNQKVNVHQVYFTAVIDTLGNIQVFDDIYSLDGLLYKELLN